MVPKPSPPDQTYQSPTLGRLPQIAIVAGVGILLSGGLLFHHWQPQQQLRSHTESFLKAVEDRNWERVGGLMASDYQDGWGLNKASALTYGEETFQHFATLSLNPLGMEITAEDDQQGRVRTQFEVRGIGSPIATLTKNEINGLDQPFVFYWQRQSWRPFDWLLVGIENPALQLDLSHLQGGEEN